MQTDPIGYADGINWYAYCGNNPIGYIDPFGLDWFDNFANFWAGAADSLSFGLTGLVRKAMRVNSAVNYRSKSYIAGEYTEIAVEVAVTLGSSAFKTAAKKAVRTTVRGQATRMYGKVASDLLEKRAKSTVKKRFHHLNTLFGHPPKKGLAIFPLGGLPASVHSARGNLTLIDDALHVGKHVDLYKKEQAFMKVFNPAMTGLRATRNVGMDIYRRK
jgi:hypothetical protein